MFGCSLFLLRKIGAFGPEKENDRSRAVTEIIELPFIPAGGDAGQGAQTFIKDPGAERVGPESGVRGEDVAGGEAELEELDETEAKARHQENRRKLGETTAA
jgi:hypothetical protein